MRYVLKKRWNKLLGRSEKKKKKKLWHGFGSLATKYHIIAENTQPLKNNTDVSTHTTNTWKIKHHREKKTVEKKSFGCLEKRKSKAECRAWAMAAAGTGDTEGQQRKMNVRRKHE